MKKCKQGYYYCYKDKKCKKIPTGYRVGLGGWLRKEKESEKSDSDSETNGDSTETNGKTNGNGNGNGGDGGGAVSEGWSDKYKKSINCDNPKGFSQRAHCQGRKKKMNEAKEKQDHEVSMAKTQVKKSIDNLQKVAKVLAKKSDSDNLPAWVQAKLTDTEHHTDAAASYMAGGDDVKEEYIEEKKKGGTLHKWFKGSKSKDGKPGWVNVVTGGTCASDEPGEGTPKCVSSSKRASMTKAERKSAARRKKKADPGQQQKSGAAKPTYVSTDPKKKKKVKEEFEVTEARDVKGKGSGKKDACYHKVKSRYSVWPSAYASGALVKCRKVGAANWGNSTKKEGFEFSNWRDDFKALEIETVDLIKAEPLISEKNDGPSTPVKMDSHMNRLVPNQGAGRPGKIRLKQPMLQNAGYQPEGEVIDEAGKKCWKGYEKKGTQKLFGKTYNRCVKKEEFSNWREELSEKYAGASDKGMPGWKPYGGREKGPVPSPDSVRDRIEKIRKSINVQKAHFEPEGEIIEDWQKVNKKDKTDGMSQKAVNAYKRENPGSKLKTAVTGKVKKGSKDAKRRKSFCSRSDGQRKMHNIDCSKTPDKAICKARRRWKCK